MPRPRSHSLLAYLALRLVAPLSLAMLGLLLAGYLVYQQTILTLLLDRDSELATLAALDVEYEIREYARALQAVADNPDLIAASGETRLAALRQAMDNQEQSYYDGMAVLDERGALVASVPDGGRAPYLAMAERLQGGARASLAKPDVWLGDIHVDPQTGTGQMVLGVPIQRTDGAYAGALLGSFLTDGSELAELVGDLNPGASGFAYLVDRRGRVIYHPDASLIGADFTNRPFVHSVGQGGTGGVVWDAPDGQRWIADYSPVGETGWGVVVKELWDVAAAPAQTYGGVLLVIGAVVAVIATGLLWRAVGRLARPIGWLSEQSVQLAAGRDAAPTAASGIVEIDRLGEAFDAMAARIQAYRARLRRYVEALTRSQEEERRRIARELHDETVQTLSGIARRLEVYQAAASDPAHRAQLNDVRSQLTEALEGVRRISHDLRPPMLDDLGLLPALDALVQSTRQGPGGVAQTALEVAGAPSPLSPEQELTLYRIVQEALMNVRRHAQADDLRVRLQFEPWAVHLSVTDNGRGFTVPASLSDFVDWDSLGLMGIQERVWAGRGELSIQSAPGQGTQLHVSLPLANGRR